MRTIDWALSGAFSFSTLLAMVDCDHLKGSLCMIWKIILAILIGLGAILVIGTSAKNDPEWMEKERAKTAIELCREDERKHAGNSAALSIVVPTCEKFEADFKAKYGRNP
ncbi:hypothetical protein D9N00_18910 [Pseudomonas syringae pv. actinidiae]|nr:hypothetical protein D9N00_18910 [Pseudomonas syringae pv. actinidiae]